MNDWSDCGCGTYSGLQRMIRLGGPSGVRVAQKGAAETLEELSDFVRRVPESEAA